MKPADFDRVFGRGRLRMVTGDHVEVFREAAGPGERRRYTKRFLATAAGDFRPWTEREWRILARLVGHGVGPVPDVVQFDRGAADRPALVQTYDAGVTLDHWVTLLPVERDGRLHGHAFEDCAHWWALARHGLAALDAIHQLQVVHLDLKADNLCIPTAPLDVDLDGAALLGSLHLRFEQIALIDFAFSLVSGERLVGALPIARQFDFDYQSPRLLEALEAGRRGDLGPTRELDWRCDFFSLAAMLRRLLPDPELAPATGTGWTVERLVAARALVRGLIAVHDDALPTTRPHAELVARADAVLGAPDLARSLAAGWTLAARRPESATDGPTPVTRIALPLVVVAADTEARPVASGEAAVEPMSSAGDTAAVAPTLGRVPDAAAVAPTTHHGSGTASPAAPVGPLAGFGRPSAPAATSDEAAGPSRASDPSAPRSPIGIGPPIEGERRSSARLPIGAAGRRRAAWAAGVAVATAVGVPVLADGWHTWQRSRDAGGATVATELSSATPRRTEDRAVASTETKAAPRKSAGDTPTSGASSHGAPEAAPSVREPVDTTATAARATSPGSVAAADPAAPVPGAATNRAPSGSPVAARSPGIAPSTVGERAAAPLAQAAERAAPTSGPANAGHAAGAAAPQVAAAERAGPASTRSVDGTTRPGAGIGAAAGPTGSSVGKAPGGARTANVNANARATAPATASANASAVRALRDGERRPGSTRTAQNGGDTRLASKAPNAVAMVKPAPIAPPTAAARAPEPWPHTAMARAMATLRGAIFGRHDGSETVVADASRSDATRTDPNRTDRIRREPPVTEATRADSSRIDSDAAARTPASEATRRFVVDPPRTAPIAPPKDFAVRAGELLTQHLPRVAQRAERSVLRVLYAAQRADDPSADDAVRAAAQSMPRTADPVLLEVGAAPGDARALNDAARLAYWQRGSVREAVELQTRAFGADPSNPEIVGNLAFLRLRQSPAQAETARQLALQALSLHDARHPHGRVEDWTTLAIASALAGRERDARNAWLVSLALTPSAARQCRAATEATRLYGERMRAAAEPMLVRAQASARADAGSACFFPPSRWTMNEAAR